MSNTIKTTLDTRGLTCPEPIWMLHAAIRDVGVGDTIKMLASDPSTRRDVPQFCAFLGHQLLEGESESEAESESQAESGTYTYLICKGR